MAQQSGVVGRKGQGDGSSPEVFSVKVLLDGWPAPKLVTVRSGATVEQIAKAAEITLTVDLQAMIGGQAVSPSHVLKPTEGAIHFMTRLAAGHPPSA